jgi:hypothetical protein
LLSYYWRLLIIGSYYWSVSVNIILFETIVIVLLEIIWYNIIEEDYLLSYYWF